MAGTKRILHLTDTFGVSQGYEPVFTKLLAQAGVYRNQVIVADIYGLVTKPLKKYGNELTWKFDKDKLPEIQRAFDQRIQALRPDIVVVSCPACLGVLTDGDVRSATLEKLRGSVFDYHGVTVIVAYPITAVHRNVDTRIVTNEDGDEDKQEPYQVKDGARILRWDWERVGRYANGKQRILPDFTYSVCYTVEDLYAARDFLLDSVLISTDIETGNYPSTITCVGYTGLNAKGQIHSYVIPFFDPTKPGNVFWQSEDDHVIAHAIMREINESDVPKTMQNGCYDTSYFIRDRVPPKNWILDSQYMWWAMFMELKKGLGFIASVLLDNHQYWKDDIKGDEQESIGNNLESYWRYNAKDCYTTLLCTLYLVQLLSLKKNEGMKHVFVDAMLRAYSGLGMSMRGVKVDWRKRDEHRLALEESMNKGIERVRFMLDDDEFNINSPAHKKWLLYDLFGLRERTARGRYVSESKAKKGVNAPSAGKLPMKMAKSAHPLFEHVIKGIESALEPRVQLSNIFGHSDDSKPFGVRGGLFMPTSRFRTSFNPVGTETTRFSSSKSAFWDGGNAQNIRKEYRDWLIPDENCIFLDVDYSQSDDVFVAYESQDEEKIRVVESGMDGHSVHGEMFFKKAYDDIVAGKRAHESWVIDPIVGVRQIAKRIVHGTNFQMAAYTLYVTMGRESTVAAAHALGHADAHTWPEERLVQLCGSFMLVYRKKYPRLTKNGWYKEIADQLMREAQITNAFGITRQFLGDPRDNGTQREATAFIGQSDTAGNMNRAMYEIDHGWIQERFRDGPNPHARERPLKMTRASHGYCFSLQVHDNFLSQLDLTHPNWREAAHNLLHVMNRPVIIHGRTFSIRAEAELGIRWGGNMLEWDGKNPRDIEGIVAKLKSM